jgi:hypothetical protein
MTYSPTKYQLTHLLQDAWFRLGQFRRWVVTGGSQTTTINTSWAGVEEQIYEDDDAALIYGTVVVLEDSGGLGAAPEGEFARITDYDSSLWTLTHDTLSASVASGDKVGIASPLFPLQDMIELANIALQRLGEIDLPDTSLTVIGGETQYTLPTTIRKRPVAVNIAKTAGGWQPVQGWNVIPAAPGSNWTLTVPYLTSGQGLQVVYSSLHPKLTAFDSNISELIEPELALSALLAEAYQWYNNQVGGSNAYFLQRENKALQDLEVAKVQFQIPRHPHQAQGMPHWGTRGEYVPGTSDLRY